MQRLNPLPLILFFAFTLFAFAEKNGTSVTLLYSGEEQGQLGAHGCGTEQIGGLAHRQTLLSDLNTKYNAALNLHTGNLIDGADPNAEWVYQIGLSALTTMNTDVMCLGPNELALSRETLSALHSDYPELNFVCANMTPRIAQPYQICSISSMNVAVVGLVSQMYNQSISTVELVPPQTALTLMKAELHSNSDIVVVIFHASQEEARALAAAVPWIDVLIVASNRQTKIVGTATKPILIGKTRLVTNATQGAAIGVLALDSPGQVQQIAVSERIAPDEELSQVLSLYHQLSESDELEPDSSIEKARAIHITYFHKQGCQKCARAVRILKMLKVKYTQVVVEKHSAKEEQGLLEAMGALYEVPQTKRLTTPSIFIGKTALIGEFDEHRLEKIIQKYLTTGIASRVPTAKTHLEHAESEIIDRFHALGILAVAGAGLLDGINPCAFATIVFFISYMNLVGRSKREMLIAGSAFTLAVFLTYLLLGLGTLSFMNYLNRFSIVAKCVYLLAAIVTFTLAGLSLYDAFKAQHGRIKEITLQLPKAVKLHIHKIIREHTRASGIIAGALVIGFAISALELVCTGQVYLPTLIFVTGIEGIRIHAFAYLFLYNLMFVLPLLGVFGCVYWGVTSMQLGGVLQHHLVAVKIGIGVLLLGIGIWLMLSLV